MPVVLSTVTDNDERGEVRIRTVSPVFVSCFAVEWQLRVVVIVESLHLRRLESCSQLFRD